MRKLLLRLLVTLLVITLVSLLAGKIINYLQFASQYSMQKVFLMHTAMALLYIVAGISLAWDEIGRQRGKEGRWIVQWKKLAIMGLPLFLLGFYQVLFLFGQGIIFLPQSFTFVINGGIDKLASIALGYVIATSFSKIPELNDFY